MLLRYSLASLGDVSTRCRSLNMTILGFTFLVRKKTGRLLTLFCRKVKRDRHLTEEKREMRSWRRGVKLLKIIILLFFITISILNYRRKRENIVSVKKQPIILFGIALFTVITSYICYRFDNSVLGYLIVLSAVVLAWTFAFYPGITKDGVNIFMGSTPIITFAKFSEIKKIDIVENKDNVKLKINVFGSTFSQVYRLEDRDKVIEKIEKKK